MRKSRTDWSGVFAPIVLLLFVFAMVGSIDLTYYNYSIRRDIDGTLDRCQIAGSADRMTACLGDVIANMEDHGITEGYNTLLFPTPNDDVGLDFATLHDLRDRSDDIAQFSVDSVEYQVALDDMRGTIREMDIGAVSWSNYRSTAFWLTLAAWAVLVFGLMALPTTV